MLPVYSDGVATTRQLHPSVFSIGAYVTYLFTPSRFTSAKPFSPLTALLMQSAMP